MPGPVQIVLQPERPSRAPGYEPGPRQSRFGGVAQPCDGGLARRVYCLRPGRLTRQSALEMNVPTGNPDNLIDLRKVYS